MNTINNKIKVIITFVSIFTVVVLLGRSQLFAGPPDEPPGLKTAIQAQEANTPDLMANRDVIGTAVGLNSKGKPVIQVFARSDQVRGIPPSIDGFPVVVQVTEEFVAFACNRDERCDRPVPIGVSTGHPNITAGTIGCRVKKGTNVYALSNNHVYADENRASIGDNVLQPGRYDGGIDPADAIGTLSDFQTIKFDGTNNAIDAAIALSSLANLGKSTLSSGYGTPKSSTVSPKVNMKVKKFGRTTGLTKGRITSINATVDVQYNTGTARFVNQIIISGFGFSKGGDSGSLIVVNGGADDLKPVGLLFAGSTSLTVANEIKRVVDRFEVTIDGQ